MAGDLIANPHRDKKRGHLRKADEISSVFDFKCRVSSAHFNALGKPNHLHFPRLAIMVARKTDRLAARRNYMKRIVREYFRKNQTPIDGLDIVLRIIKPFVKKDFALINQEIATIFTKIHKCRAS